MAVAFVNKTQQSGLGTTTSSVALPTGTVVGTLLILIVSTWSNTSVTTPSGWTALTRAAGTGGTYIAHVDVMWKIATSADITAGSVTASFSANSEFAVGLLAYSGHDPVTPINTSNQSAATSAGTTLTSPTITTTVNGCVIVQAWGGVTNATQTNSITQPATTRHNAGPGGGIVAGASSEQSQVTAGAVSSLTATQANTGSWAATTLAIAPSTGGGGSSYTGWGIPL